MSFHSRDHSKPLLVVFLYWIYNAAIKKERIVCFNPFLNNGSICQKNTSNITNVKWHAQYYKYSQISFNFSLNGLSNRYNDLMGCTDIFMKQMEECKQVHTTVKSMALSIYGMLVAFVFILGATTEISEARCNKRYVTHVIRKRNCFPRALLSVACLGTCTSYTKPSTDNPGSVERFCECCREGSSRQVTVNMICLDGATQELTNISLSVMIPTSCMCRPCSVLPDTIVPAEQHIFQHTGIKRSSAQISAQNIENGGSRINSKHLKDLQEKNRHDNLV